MIIGYYPGAGGNRYYQYSNNDDFSLPGVAYDNLTSNTLITSRGLYYDTAEPLPYYKNDTILTHCVNYDQIVKVLGPRATTNVVLIKADLKKSLRREWSIKGKNKPMFMKDANSLETFILELYTAIKDPSWPAIYNLPDYYSLPNKILQEVQDSVKENLKYIDSTGIYNYLESAFTAIVWHNKLYNKFPFDVGQSTLIDIDTDDTEFGQIMRNEFDLYENSVLFNFAWEVWETHGDQAPIIDLYQEKYGK